jgi:hypothetical protein
MARGSPTSYSATTPARSGGVAPRRVTVSMNASGTTVADATKVPSMSQITPTSTGSSTGTPNQIVPRRTTVTTAIPR